MSEQDYLKRREEELMSQLVEIKKKQLQLSPSDETAKDPSPHEIRNMLIMMETATEKRIQVPENFKSLPSNLQKIIIREQQRNMEICNALKEFEEISAGVYALKDDKEKRPAFTCRGAILEFFAPDPGVTAITAGLELVVRRFRWTKAKVLGARDFHTTIMKIAKQQPTKIEIINPPIQEDTSESEDTGRLVGNKMTKGMKN